MPQTIVKRPNFTPTQERWLKDLPNDILKLAEQHNVQKLPSGPTTDAPNLAERAWQDLDFIETEKLFEFATTTTNLLLSMCDYANGITHYHRPTKEYAAFQDAALDLIREWLAHDASDALYDIEDYILDEDN